jgi:hypothetical protein
MRNLDNRKARNILELEVDEIVADAAEGVISLRALNFFSPRPSSFINLIVGEGFTNLFFGLLNSSGKSAEVP